MQNCPSTTTPVEMMDPVFAKFVDDAADVATSGRWAAMNAEIERLAAEPGPDNAWYVQLFGSLSFYVFSEYLLLRNTYAAKRTGEAPLLAWRARNLLELSVWATYCARSREKARRFYEDAGRDVLNLFNAFRAWGQTTEQCTDWPDSFTGAEQDLFKRAASDGIEDLNGSYTDVRKAAEECGIVKHYAVYFKLLSKFAHPTAMQILAPPDEAREAMQKDYFFSCGCLFFTGAFVALESRLTQSGHD